MCVSEGSGRRFAHAVRSWGILRRILGRDLEDSGDSFFVVLEHVPYFVSDLASKHIVGEF